MPFPDPMVDGQTSSFLPLKQAVDTIEHTFQDHHLVEFSTFPGDVLNPEPLIEQEHSESSITDDPDKDVNCPLLDLKVPGGFPSLSGPLEASYNTKINVLRRLSKYLQFPWRASQDEILDSEADVIDIESATDAADTDDATSSQASLISSDTNNYDDARATPPLDPTDEWRYEAETAKQELKELQVKHVKTQEDHARARQDIQSFRAQHSTRRHGYTTSECRTPARACGYTISPGRLETREKFVDPRHAVTEYAERKGRKDGQPERELPRSGKPTAALKHLLEEMERRRVAHAAEVAERTKMERDQLLNKKEKHEEELADAKLATQSFESELERERDQSKARQTELEEALEQAVLESQVFKMKSTIRNGSYLILESKAALDRLEHARLLAIANRKADAYRNPATEGILAALEQARAANRSLQAEKKVEEREHREETKSWKAENTRLVDAHAKIEIMLEDLQREKRELLRDHDRSFLEASVLDSKVTSLENERDSLLAEKTAAAEASRAARTSATAIASKLHSRICELEAKAKTTGDEICELKNLCEQLHEDKHRMRKEEAAILYREALAAKAHEAEIDECRKRIQVLQAVNAAKDIEAQRRATAKLHQRKVAEAKERQKEEKKRQEKERRAAEQAERARREEIARREEEESARKKHEEERWRHATSEEVHRCHSRDVPWPSHAKILERFQSILKEFEKTEFSKERPLTIGSIPWPLWYHLRVITPQEPNWEQVKQFLEFARGQLESNKFNMLLKKIQQAFHPDKWRSRNLMKTVMNENHGKDLDKAGVIVSQAVNNYISSNR